MSAVSPSGQTQLKRQFVILAASRSGSNMLCTMLDSHPSVLCHHELYNPKGIRLAVALRETGFSLGTMAERDQDPEAFLDRIWSRQAGIECVGFKFTHRQNEKVFQRLLSDASIAKIVLRRNNRMKTYVSQKISETLLEWEVYREKDRVKNRPKVTVDPDAFLERVAFDEAYYSEVLSALSAAEHDWMQVYYEDLFSPQTHNALVGFLGLTPVSGGLTIGSVKQNPRNLRDLIANFDELQCHFAETEFASELDDQGN